MPALNPSPNQQKKNSNPIVRSLLSKYFEPTIAIASAALFIYVIYKFLNAMSLQYSQIELEANKEIIENLPKIEPMGHISGFAIVLLLAIPILAFLFWNRYGRGHMRVVFLLFLLPYGIGLILIVAYIIYIEKKYRRSERILDNWAYGKGKKGV
ncbi:hypothetical protein PEDI_52630 [Persicobacter diffluens]|uniref:Uncharacterized protein n=2 Tax=Persicobacter diffluens TaxID=981 RepID=A0AAN4W4V5_9BACT|nr:hypothetical protein PEDI_52630 [Persicobacter diffluens]